MTDTTPVTQAPVQVPAQPEGFLVAGGAPIVVPSGPLEDGTKKRIEDAVGLNVPAGSHVAIMALLDEDGKAKPEGKFGVAWKMDDHWKIAGETDVHWGGSVSGYVGIVGVF